jgi:hypothetical protein
MKCTDHNKWWSLSQKLVELHTIMLHMSAKDNKTDQRDMSADRTLLYDALHGPEL